jgi:hypothetical protein
VHRADQQATNLAHHQLAETKAAGAARQAFLNWTDKHPEGWGGLMAKSARKSTVKRKETPVQKAAKTAVRTTKAAAARAAKATAAAAAKAPTPSPMRAIWRQL